MGKVDSHKSRPIQITLLIIGLLLCAWSLADDYLIGGGPGFGVFQIVVLVVGILAIASAFAPSGVASAILATYISLFAALGLGELVLGSFLAPRFASAYELNETFLYRLKPGSVREYAHTNANGGSRHNYQVNSLGYRGEELLTHTDRHTRIVVYGDSFIHAEYSELEKTFTERLEHWIALARNENVEVINAGVAGYGPDQIALRIGAELPKLNPDIVVVSIYSGNDFGDLVRNKLFKVDEKMELVRSFPTLSQEIVFQAELAEREFFVRKVARNVREQYQQTAQPLDAAAKMAAILAQQISEYESYVLHSDNVVSELRSDPYSADISLFSDSPSGRYKISLMAGVMREIATTVHSFGVPLIFIILPHPTDVLLGRHASVSIDRDVWPQYSPDRLVQSLLNICHANSLNCFSLMQTMREKGGENLFLKGGDDHWNDKGQDVAAQAVAEYLERR